MAQARDIGIDVPAPKKACSDAHCPFHGSFPVRGAVIVGQVVSAKMERTVVVERELRRYIPKYERFEKRTSRHTAHASPCLEVRVGDLVTIAECRPISKSKTYVVVKATRGALDIEGEDATKVIAEEAQE